jgi:hypothetical protein
MANQPWLDDLHERLAKHALPQTYIRRFMEEVSDHFQDITEENMSTEANVYSRLGEPAQVAKAAVTSYRRRSFIGRHPMAAFLVFAVSPVVSLIILFLTSAVLIGLISFGLGITNNRLNQFDIFGSGVVILAYSFLTIVIPSIIACIIYCRLARRLNINRRCIIVSCMILAVFASSVSSWRRFDIPPGENCWYFGVGWAGFWCGGGWISLTQNLIQLIVPLAIGWWFMRRMRDQERSLFTTGSFCNAA